MTKPELSLSAPSQAASHPPAIAEWDRSSRLRGRVLAGSALVVLVAAGTASAGNGPRLAPPGCITHTVKPGDTAWQIAVDAGVTLDVIGTLNKQIQRLDLIRPGDTIAVSCPGPKNTPADPKLPAPVIVMSNEVQKSTTVDVSKWFGERDPQGRMTWRSVAAYAYQAGWRGNDLVTMVALVPGESGRYLTGGDGDVGAIDSVWGPSIRPLMVRSVKAQKGTGAQRDEDLLRTLPGNFKSAFELYESAKERGAAGKIYPTVKTTIGTVVKTIAAHVWRPFDDWSAFLNESYLASEDGVPRLELARTAAHEIGVA